MSTRETKTAALLIGLVALGALRCSGVVGADEPQKLPGVFNCDFESPCENDGILRGWVDGQLVFEKTDVRMRDVQTLKIETVWINLYYGGTWTATANQHLFIDDVAIGRQRVGP